MPQRTTLRIVGVDADGYAVIDWYKCMDCKLITRELNVILIHQERPGLWHRLKRWAMRLPNRPILRIKGVDLGGDNANR